MFPPCEADTEAQNGYCVVTEYRYVFSKKMNCQTLRDNLSIRWSLLQNTDEATHRVLNSFDLSSPGYTLIMPKNIGKDYRDYKHRNFGVLEIFGIDPLTTPTDVATEVRTGRKYRPKRMKISKVIFWTKIRNQ